VDYDQWRVVLEASSGKFVVDSIDPQSFATILRTVADGEVPFITIGTEPSDRVGYAKVTVAPSLQGTRAKGLSSTRPMCNSKRFSGVSRSALSTASTGRTIRWSAVFRG
jgi:hypothetical protein